MKQTTSWTESFAPQQTVQTSVQAPERDIKPAGQDLFKESVNDYILTLVSEKTGYPKEMLDLELDLEADLGIDTVKQAELFASIREYYGIPRREDLILADYNTLAKVIQFVMTSTTEMAEEDNSVPVETEDNEEDQPEVKLVRRIPRPIPRPKLELCLPTGITLSPGDKVLLFGKQNKLVRAFEKYLTGLQVTALVCSPDDEIDQFTEEKIKGVFFLAGFKKIGQFSSLSLEKLRTRLDRQVYSLYHLMTSLNNLQFLVAITKSDGLHGYGEDNLNLTLNGGIAGFCKSLARENEDLLVKVVDFEPDTDLDWVVERAVREVASDPTVVEVGWHGKERMTIGALPEDRTEKQNLQMGSDTVFLISGGAGGVSVPIARDLALRTRGTFILLGRTDLPDENNPYINQAMTDRAGLKQRLISDAAHENQRLTPAQIEKQLDRYAQQGRINQVLEGIRDAGAQAEYLTCDVMDDDAVRKVVSHVVDHYGKVDVFIHAAGIEKSRMLVRKSAEEFRQVVEVKVIGFFNLFSELISRGNQLKAVQVFTSVAGRCGNPGQTDYAAANDLLCRWMMTLTKEFPETKFQALDWSAWSEVGMATRGFIPRAMARAGIEMLPTKVAAPQVWHELALGDSGEVVLAGKLGALEEQMDSTGGMDIPKANEALRAGDSIHIMFSELTGLNLSEGFVLEADLDPKTEAFLHDHELNGVPVLPGVMGIEGFNVAARHIASVLGTEGPDFTISQFRQIRFEKALKFYHDEPRHITWKAQVIHRKNEMIAEVRLSSLMRNRLGDTQTTEHFSGQAILEPTEILLPDRWRSIPEWGSDTCLLKDDIYQIFFHGPAFQVLAGVQRKDDYVLGKLQPDFTTGSKQLMQLSSHPMLIELCFQTAGVFEIGTTGKLRLPSSVAALRIYPNQVNGRDVYAFVKPRTILDNEMSFDAWVVDEDGKVYLEIKDYRTVQLPYKLDASLVSPFKQVLGIRD
jgi:NAD(P)-dependent dehydrogenase (short-subunit alcohol dehydrogenase family)/acyl carrier protein